MESRAKPSNAGFTFLEVLVALSLVSISIVALMNCQTISLKNYVDSQIISRATLLAEEKISEIEAKGLQEIDDEKAEEYENGFRYIIDGNRFYDEEQTEFYQPEWRWDYWWMSTVEETEYEGVRKITVEVWFWESEAIAPWDVEDLSPKVRIVTYIASTNRREDARNGSASSARTQPRPG